ncbi:zf-DHHC-domain-containing protein [Hesseltinella vesiculosa]|uniref:Palmitoyltransferase n=1 Tax=Hesseltinella vesiculosa TaxID=101127 RepID=A0A1X2G9V4_9FUNG|nr:zf-DHHC-domain-containing protein [Hesseltinella vesiculosa]
MPRKTLKGQLIVTLVTAMIAFVAYASQLAILWSYLGGASLHTALILIPFNFFIIMIFVNYALTCLTDPGHVPPNWIPEDQRHLEVKRSTHAPRFCKKCNNFKPPRTHHCSSCGVCVLKMDHHCPWVNNCVGFANYGHFIRMLVYVEISTIYLTVLLSCAVADAVHHATPIADYVWTAILLFLCFMVFLGVTILGAYHVYCITTNTTTIEGFEKGKSLTLKSMDTVHEVVYPYDQGVFNNLCFALGKQPLFWLWPQQMEGSGLSFPLNITNLHAPGNILTDASMDEDKRSSKYSTWSTQEADYDEDEERPLSMEYVSPVPPAHPRLTHHASQSTLHTPATPGSILTFTSTVSTLVDHRSSRHPLASKQG